MAAVEYTGEDQHAIAGRHSLLALLIKDPLGSRDGRGCFVADGLCAVPFVQDRVGTVVYKGPMSDEAIILPPGGGRAYDLGGMRGVIKADGPETQDRYCASEWSVEPGRSGPGPHHHESNEEIFLVTEGTMWFLLGEEWTEAPTGTFLRIPAGVTHDFENRGAERATVFNVFIPGGFEAPFRDWIEASRAGG